MNYGRVLYSVGLTVQGKFIGTVLLCASCLETRTPVNPDPLDATQAA